MRIDKAYSFEGIEGPLTLGDLFGKHGQLIVQHFMFGPDWNEGCPSCSFWSDNYNGIDGHLAARDTAFVLVSRGPLDRLEAYKKRLGWTFRWVSSAGSDFNFDFGVSFTKEQLASGSVFYNYRETPSAKAHDELPGSSSFYRNDNGEIFHTYSSYARGGEEGIGTLMILESMKMEIPLLAPRDGLVSEVRVQPGSPVRAGQRVVVLQER